MYLEHNFSLPYLHAFLNGDLISEYKYFASEEVISKFVMSSLPENSAVFAKSQPKIGKICFFLSGSLNF